MLNTVKEKLNNKKVSIGTFAHIGSPEIPEILSISGFEWVMFDMEHGPISYETTEHLMQSLKNICMPFIKVTQNDPVLIKRALDIGAVGILVPWVNSANEAKKVVEACSYPPRGIRGFGPRRCSMYGSEMGKYLSTIDNELLIIVQIETLEGVTNLEEIARVEGVDVIFVGPVDLAVSIDGVSKINETIKSKKFKEILEEIVKVSKEAEVVTGCPCDIDQFDERVSQGFKLIGIMADEMIFMHGCKEIISKIKQNL